MDDLDWSGLVRACPGWSGLVRTDQECVSRFYFWKIKNGLSSIRAPPTTFAKTSECSLYSTFRSSMFHLRSVGASQSQSEPIWVSQCHSVKSALVCSSQSQSVPIGVSRFQSGSVGSSWGQSMAGMVSRGQLVPVKVKSDIFGYSHV